jgi:beta-lactamase regulating signal transducer with metallopeptidase domain
VEHAEMPESQLGSVVIHEPVHIRRGDFLANLLGSVAMLLYWPSPLFALRLQFLEHKLVAAGELRIRCSRETQRWATESSRF